MIYLHPTLVINRQVIGQFEPQGIDAYGDLTIDVKSGTEYLMKLVDKHPQKLSVSLKFPRLAWWFNALIKRVEPSNRKGWTTIDLKITSQITHSKNKPA